MPTVFDSNTPKTTPHIEVKKAPIKKPISVRLQTPVPMGLLTCFAVNPTGVRFETQDEEETIILFLRQHIIVNLPWVIGAILLFFVPTLLPVVLQVAGISFPVPLTYTIIGTAFWYLALYGFILAKFLGWFFNIYIVTNERVIDIDFYYLLYKKFSQAELNKIQDISFSSGGIVATVFNYGNVIVETAGESPNLEFDRVPFPDKVVETIRNLTEQGDSPL